MTDSALRILLVVKQAADATRIRHLLLCGSDTPYLFSEVASGASLMCMLKSSSTIPFDCVVLDFYMADMDAMQILTQLRECSTELPCPIIVVTGGERGIGPALVRLGAQDYLGKDSLTPESLSRTIENAMERFALLRARREIETDLIEAKAVAERANRAKSDFLSNMSHELRTPLNAILGFAQLIDSGQVAPNSAQQRSLNQILKAGWYLLELINEILDLAQVESGKLSLSLEAVSLARALNDCKAMVATLAMQREVSLHFLHIDEAFCVCADATRFKQALLNVLSNAIKYNHFGGSVTVSFECPKPARLRVLIADSGPGLAPEQLAQLFQPFNRIGQEANALEGSGIGLVMTKRLIELMGGSVDMQSSVGHGSVFCIELALKGFASHDTDALVSAPAALQLVPHGLSRTVLYVEDNPANLMLIEELIARRGDLIFLCASNAFDGIALAQSSIPDVILMDINLPGMSGYEALAVLQSTEETAHIPVIALSANAMAADIQRGIDAGFFSYLTKPIRVDKFMNNLDLALRQTTRKTTHD